MTGPDTLRVEREERKVAALERIAVELRIANVMGLGPFGIAEVTPGDAKYMAQQLALAESIARGAS